MKICFLLTHVPDPKTNKRIVFFKKYGEVSVICARRASQDIWNPAFDDVKHFIYDIDLPSSQKIVKRYFVSKKFQRNAFSKLLSINPDIVYADGLDSLMIASKFKKRKQSTLVYDVADLRETFIEKPKKLLKRIIVSIIKKFEKKYFKNVDYLVITSEKFYEVHYYKLISKDKVIFIPNVPDKSIFSSYEKKEHNVFTIGFIGGIRYLQQMKLLVDAAATCKCNVLFAGAGGTLSDYQNISDYCKNKTNVRFTGKYVYNTDIVNLYEQVDCVYAVYDADNPNVRIALPNKLYESVLCSLPIIVAKNTYLSELVSKWKVGVSVSHNNIDELIKEITHMRDDKVYYNNLVASCNLIKDDMDMEKYNIQLEKVISK